ncbi:MAG: hypothetical protein H0V93_02360 [Euzebyales bacterium]|nr:hypothetical protein [Euzebyales bacterium]
MTTELAQERRAPADPDAPRGRPAPWWVLAAAGAFLVAWYGARVAALGPTALNDDLGIQHYLARITAEGAIPLIDFEHGWNTASWYWNAGLYLLAGGNPTLWAFLWGPVTGGLLAGLLLLAAARRLRLEAAWVAALVPAWVLLTHVPHHKYATAMGWLLALLPVGLGRRDGAALALRLGVPATVWWFHVELAVLLAAGTALFDLLGDTDVVRRARILRAAAVGGGLAVGLGSQLAAYAGLGLAPGEVVDQILLGQTGAYDLHFGYLLGNPQTFRVLVYPATLVLPFVPLVWRRLATPTRLVAFLHLALALIPIRRPGDGHVAAAATLLAVLAVLAARDLLRARGVSIPWPSLRDGHARSAGAAALAGATWFAVAIAAGFRVTSLMAIVALTLVCLLGVVASWGGDRPWASAGAMAAAGLLVVGGLSGRVVQQARADDGDGQAQAIAAQLRGTVDGCLGPERAAWVVPSPLTLYDELELTNPTPYYVFWYTFAAEGDSVLARADAGQIPAIITPYGWPESMRPIVDDLEARYEVCAQVEVPATDNLVTVWRYAGS